MIDNPILFEQVVAHLLKAKHNVKLDCMFDGSARKIQIDGYREVHVDALLAPMKVGIECRRKKRPVRRREISAFSKEVERCKLHLGIMVSFSGFQSGAIDEAKVEKIRLFEFRQSVADDFIRKMHVINYKPINPGHWSVRAHLDTGISSSELLNAEEELLKSSGEDFHDVHVYAKNEVRIGKLSDIITDLIEREVFWRGTTEGTIDIDWSARRFFLHLTSKGENVVRRVFSIVVSYQLPKIRKYITQFNPSDWYIMKNAIENSYGLIRLSRVQEIEDLYRNVSE